MYKIIVFSKLKRKKIDFHITSGQQCGQLTGEHVGIGTCDVDVDIGLDLETVDKPLELFDILNLIQKDIVCFVFDQQILDMGVNLVDVAKGQRVKILKVVELYLFLLYTITNQFIGKHHQ